MHGVGRTAGIEIIIVAAHDLAGDLPSPSGHLSRQYVVYTRDLIWRRDQAYDFKGHLVLRMPFTLSVIDDHGQFRPSGCLGTLRSRDMSIQDAP